MERDMALSSQLDGCCSVSPAPVSHLSLARGPDGFERLVGSMLGRLSGAPASGLLAALVDSLRDLCRAAGLGLASVLEARDERDALSIRVEATTAGLSAAPLLVEANETARQRIRSELAWGSLCLVDAEHPEPELEGFGEALRAQGLESCAIARLHHERPAFSCLLLASSGRTLLDDGAYSRVRLLADLIALALARHDTGRSEVETVRPSPSFLTEAALRELERQNLVRVLESCDWKVQGPNGAARALGLSPSTLRDRMKTFGVRRP
jgi:transcriptional regulator with GAF, ATPase, and Fis domain